MVTFVCQLCSATLKKNQVNRHCETVCPDAWTFVCIDCGKDFHGYEFDKHTQCVTEAEKYRVKKKPAKWRGWKNTIKRLLKQAGKKGMDRKELEDKVIGIYAESDHSSDNPTEMFGIKIRNKKFVTKKDRVIFYKYFNR